MAAIYGASDAVVLAAGATKPRDLPIEGRCARAAGVGAGAAAECGGKGSLGGSGSC